jgi:hypothetical protein
MIISEEEQLIKWDRICNTAGLSHYDRAKEYAKWYAEQVIKYCAEVAEVDTVKEDQLELNQSYMFSMVNPIVVSKQSILNVINEL